MASQAVKAFGVANYDALPPGSAEAVTVGAVTGEWTMHKLTIRGDHSSLTITEVADGD